MEIFSQIASMHAIKTGMLIVCLIVGLIIFIYNWLYLVRMVSSFDQTDLSPPSWMEHIVKASIFTALFTVFIIVILFITRFY